TGFSSTPDSKVEINADAAFGLPGFRRWKDRERGVGVKTTVFEPRLAKHAELLVYGVLDPKGCTGRVTPVDRGSAGNSAIRRLRARIGKPRNDICGNVLPLTVRFHASARHRDSRRCSITRDECAETDESIVILVNEAYLRLVD